MIKSYHRKHINPERCFSDSHLYYRNAKEFLGKSEIEYGIYKNRKLVREASGIGYLSILEAINGFLRKTYSCVCCSI